MKQTAQEFNLPYHEYKTTRKAIISHFKHFFIQIKKAQIGDNMTERKKINELTRSR